MTLIDSLKKESEEGSEDFNEDEGIRKPSLIETTDALEVVHHFLLYSKNSSLN